MEGNGYDSRIAVWPSPDSLCQESGQQPVPFTCVGKLHRQQTLTDGGFVVAGNDNFALPELHIEMTWHRRL
jgi:hypothetical protein